jgi:GNAT superfamily N-acetyltransferase
LDIELRTLTGTGIKPWLTAIARLRIQVFREFPYLYAGDEEYEQQYLQPYVRSARGVVVVALDRDRAVGATTALPLADADGEFQEAFRDHPIPATQWYYFGESVLLRDYRGLGIGHRFFDIREAAALAHGYEHATFCAVVRPPDHPMRPPDYRTHDAFWHKRGFHPDPSLTCEYPWLDIGDSEETRKVMIFWVKTLS